MTQPTRRASEAEQRSERMRAQRRQQILEAAKKVFAEHGYHNASINEIIRQADIARGTFYLYFSSKQLVFESILEEALAALRSRIASIDVSEGAPPPQVQLRGSLIRVVEYLVADQAFTRLLLNQGLGTEDEAAERVASFYSLCTELIESSIVHGIQMGLVRSCEPRLIASALLGAVRGVIGTLLDTTEPNIEQVVDELIAFALCGVVVPKRWFG